MNTMLTGSLTILGCGTSTGVPLPGCQCTVCTSTNPKNSRCRTAAWVRTDTHSIIIDTPADFRWQALKYKVRKVNGVLYTHSHADHIMGMDDLRSFNFTQKEAIPCFANQSTCDALKRIFSYIFSPDPNYKGGMLPQLTLSELEAGKEFSFDQLKITPFELPHGQMKVLGYRIGDLAYATDCKAVPEPARNLLKGIKTLILDGLRFEEHPTHLSIPQAIEVAKQIGAEHTYLTHLTHTVDYETVADSLPGGIQLAYDGLQISFKY